MGHSSVVVLYYLGVVYVLVLVIQMTAPHYCAEMSPRVLTFGAPSERIQDYFWVPSVVPFYCVVSSPKVSLLLFYATPIRRADLHAKQECIPLGTGSPVYPTVVLIITF